MDYNLSSGLLEEIMRGTEEKGVQPIMQVLGCKRIAGSQGNDRYRLLLSDGKHVVSFAMLAAQLNVIVEKLSTFSIVKILQYVTSNLQSSSKGDRRILVLLNLEVITSGDVVGKKIGSPTQLNMAEIEQDDCSSTSHTVANKNTSYSNSMSTASSSKSPTKVVNAVNGSSSSEPGLIHPIESINPYQSGWTLKVRVVKKDAIRTWSNSKGDGKLFSMTVCDESGDIRVTAFNNEVDKFYETIQVDKAYYIKNCTIKPSNKQYNPTNHDYEMTFNRDTTVVECFDKVVSNIHYKFVDVKTIATMNKDQIIDVIGICKSASEVQHVTQRSTSRDIIKREVVLVDQTNNSIQVTLWGKEAEEFEGSKNPVILIKAAKITEYLGSKSLSVLFNSMLKIDPDIPEAHKLRGWYDNGGSELEATHISTRTGQSSSGSTHEISLIDIQKLKLGSNAVADYFHVNAYIGMIKTDNITYMACPKPECNKKVEIAEGQYRCGKCNEKTPNFKYRYLMQLDICDYSGHMWVSAFANECEKILIKTADEMGEWLEQDRKSAIEYISSKCFKMYSFKCRIKLENYDDKNRFRTTIMNVANVDYPKYNNLLITGIKNLLKIEE